MEIPGHIRATAAMQQHLTTLGPEPREHPINLFMSEPLPPSRVIMIQTGVLEHSLTHLNYWAMTSTSNTRNRFYTRLVVWVVTQSHAIPSVQAHTIVALEAIIRRRQTVPVATSTSADDTEDVG
jgi:hypothetical protein